VVQAPGGVRVVRALAGPDRWYALADPPAVGNADVETARAVRNPITNEPVVDFELTAHGRTMFHALTREIAHRGADAHVPGTRDPMAAVQHLAIVLDDQLSSVPFINHQEVPDGIDGSVGVSIEGGLSEARAREIAILLESGAMPATLAPAP
jgi:preprotein translocase subunit SecD